MKKLNNKGMTLIELLISFAITSAIVVSMFNVILNYQTEQSTEALKSDIIAYKNTITKLIQADIIKGELKSVDIKPIKQVNNYTEYGFILTFNRNLGSSSLSDPDSLGSGGVLVKELTVRTSNTEENYITYDDINNKGVLQSVKYALPSVGKGIIPAKDNQSTTETNLTKFTAVSTNVNDYTKVDPVTFLNLGINYFDLDITISNNELGGDYHIKIIAPLNYSYCKQKY